VLSGRGLCDELITRPEDSYRLWCVVVCDLETSKKKGNLKRIMHSIYILHLPWKPFCHDGYNSEMATDIF